MQLLAAGHIKQVASQVWGSQLDSQDITIVFRSGSLYADREG